MAIEAFDPFGADDDDDFAPPPFEISPKQIDFSNSSNPFDTTFSCGPLTHLDPPPPPPLPSNRSSALQQRSSIPPAGIQTPQKDDQMQSGGNRSVELNKSNSSQHVLVDDDIQRLENSFQAMAPDDNTKHDVRSSRQFHSHEFDANISNESKSRFFNAKNNNIKSGESIDSQGNIAQYVTPAQKRPPSEEIVFTLSEEMSTIHNSKRKQYTLSVRGVLSAQSSLSGMTHPNRRWDVDFDDPNGEISDIITKKYDYAQPMSHPEEFGNSKDHDDIKSNEKNAKISKSFRVHTPEASINQWSGIPLVEYKCGNGLRPVPMLITKTAQMNRDKCHVHIHLRVNPRNKSALHNLAILMSIPDAFNGQTSLVSPVGATGDSGLVKHNWDEMKRLLTWSVEELQSGEVREFKASLLIATSTAQNESVVLDADDFPIMLRYDSEGCLLSSISLGVKELSVDCVKHQYRVYHREI